MNESHIFSLAEALSREGVQRTFGVTGSGNSLQLIRAMEQQGIAYFPVAHEAAAALMAGAACRNGKTRAAALSIKGPGLANMLPGILSNRYENRPACTIAEAYASDAPTFRRHKRLSHSDLLETLTKGYAKVDGNPETIERIFSVARSETPGPIHLDLAPKADTAEIRLCQEAESRDEYQTQADKIFRIIRQAKKPALALGSLVGRMLPDLDWASFFIPVATTAAAKGTIDEHSAFAAGVITGEVKNLSPETLILSKADVVIGIGLRNTEVIQARKMGQTLVMFDYMPGYQDGFDADFVLINRSLRMLVDELQATVANKSWGDDLITRHKVQLKTELVSGGWDCPTVIDRLAELNVPGDPLVCDTGLFCTIVETLWPCRKNADYCGSSNGRFMGTAIPTAIGLSLAEGKIPAICMAGDGGIRPYFPEIRMAVEYQLPILFVLIADGGYGTIGSADLNQPIHAAAQIKQSSWWKPVEAMGCASMQVGSLPELAVAVSRWQASGKPAFIELQFEPEKYRRMTFDLR